MCKGTAQLAYITDHVTTVMMNENSNNKKFIKTKSTHASQPWAKNILNNAI